MEKALRELIELARERWLSTDDPFKKERLATGIRLGEELLTVYDALRPLAARQVGQILEEWQEGGLFDGENGRSDDTFGSSPEA